MAGCAIIDADGRRFARMKQTTLCYIERGDQYLMLHRTKKAHD